MRNSMTYADAMKEVRATAKKNGLIFKRQNSTINGQQAYKFVSKDSGKVLGENFTLWSAYENCMSGYVEKMNY